MSLKAVRFYLKAALALTVFGTCSIYGVLCSIFFFLIGKRHLAQWSTARAFYYSFSTIMGIRIKLVNGERLNGLPAIIVGNHQSGLDILVLGRIFPPGCTVTSKKSLKWIPFLGWFMTLSGTFFLDRSNREKSVQTLNKVLDDLKAKKRGLYIFPEGTRSYASTPTLLPFKKGAFHLAQQAKVPIIPIVVSNTSTLIDAKTKTFETGEIIIHVLPPVSTENLKPEEVSALSEKVREDMLNELQKIGYSIPDSTVKSINETEELAEQDDDDEYESVPNESEPSTSNLKASKSNEERTSLLSKSD